MFTKKFILAWVAMFVLSMLVGFVVHGALLGEHYSAMAGMFRTKEDSEAYCWYMFLAHILMSFGLVWIYTRGKQNRPWLGQGIRYGLGIIALTTIPMYLIYYAVQPMPGDLVLKQIIFDSIGMLVMTTVLAKINP